MSIVEESVIYLFKELEAQNIPIVVMRNYQNLPDIGNDLDAALKKEDIAIVREIFKSEYIKQRWTAVCEVKTHNSTVDAHNIFVFKFFNTDLDEYMQIDFFQGFLFKGQPFFNISDFIENKREFNKFPVLSANIEMTIKYFQIYNAIDAQQWERVNKYTLQAKNLIAETDKKYKHLDFELLNGLLLSNEYDNYKIILNNYRNNFLRDKFTKNPIQFIYQVVKRVGSFFRFYAIDPFIVNCTFSINTDKIILKKVLESLVDCKCFRYYYFTENLKPKERIKQYIKMASSGGVIVSFNKNGVYFDNEHALKKYIISEFVNRHNRIL